MVLEDTRLQPATLAAFVQRGDELRDETIYPLASAFPVEEVEDVENVYDIVQQQMNVAASITGFNSGSPIRDKGQGAQALATLTKIQDAYYLDERQLLRYRNPRTDAERQAIVDSVLMNTNDLSDGVEKTKELIRASLAYKGVFEYEDPRTQTKLSFELERPEENNLTVSQEWGTEDARPFDDLQAAIDQYKKTNGNAAPEVINMNSATFTKLKRSGQVKLELYGQSDSPRIVKDTDVNELLNSLSIPPIQVDDTVTAIRQLDGTNKITQHLEDGRVVLRAALLGSTMSGPAVENNYAKGKFVQPVVSYDPPGEKTIVGEAAMPVLKNLNGTVFLTIGETKAAAPTE